LRTAAAHHQPGVLPGVFPALTCTRPPPPRHSVGSFWAVAVCLSQGANERENSAALGRGGGCRTLWYRVHMNCGGAMCAVWAPSVRLLGLKTRFFHLRLGDGSRVVGGCCVGGGGLPGSGCCAPLIRCAPRYFSVLGARQLTPPGAPWAR